jgi:hypothetical protein
MRMQLSRPRPHPALASRILGGFGRLGILGLVATVSILLGAFYAGIAAAEQLSQNPSGEAVFRGNYWRDRNTRVVNPTVDVRQDLPAGVSLGAHYLLDAITSASIAAGATSDMPFTELRHEAGFNVAVPIGGKHRLAANYSYSTESDYWSHSAGLRAIFNLFQDNTTLLFGGDYGHNTVGKRLGPTGYLLMGTMQTGHLAALWTQVLSRRALMSVSYEVSFLRGYQNNPYRPAFVGGPGGLERRETEHLPDFRVRHVVALSGHVLLPTSSGLVPHVTLRPGFRAHFDSWGLKAFNPEFATHVPVGPTEFRLLLSFYDQTAADLYRAEGGCVQNYVPDTPAYCGGPIEWGTTVDSSGNPMPNYVYTSDVKLGSYSTYSWELAWKWRLSFLHRLGALGERLSRMALELAGGMWFATRAVGWQYGMPLTSDDPRAPAGCSSACAAAYANLGIYVPL